MTKQLTWPTVHVWLHNTTDCFLGVQTLRQTAPVLSENKKIYPFTLRHFSVGCPIPMSVNAFRLNVHKSGVVCEHNFSPSMRYASFILIGHFTLSASYTFPWIPFIYSLVLFVLFFFPVLKVVNRRVDRQAANQVQVKATKKTTFFHTLWLTLYTKHRGHTWFASISPHHIVLTQTRWSFSQRTLFKTDNFVLHAITANFCFFESFFFKMITKGYHLSFIDSSFKADGQWKWTG